MKLQGTCSLSKENEVTGGHDQYQRRVIKKKKKKNGTPILGEWDSYFLAGTLTFYKKGVPDSYF